MYVYIKPGINLYILSIYKNGYIKVNRNEYFKEKKVDFP